MGFLKAAFIGLFFSFCGHQNKFAIRYYDVYFATIALKNNLQEQILQPTLHSKRLIEFTSTACCAVFSSPAAFSAASRYFKVRTIIVEVKYLSAQEIIYVARLTCTQTTATARNASNFNYAKLNNRRTEGFAKVSLLQLRNIIAPMTSVSQKYTNVKGPEGVICAWE